MREAQLAAVDLNLLVALDALLAEGSVTRAAARIGRTQSAMSHALARLRELFDDPLLVRTQQGMQPTPRAQELIEPIRRALADIERALSSRPSFDPARAQRSFILAMSDYQEIVILPQLLARLTEEAPGIDLVIQHRPAAIERALEAGEVDLALAPGHEPLPGIYRQPLFKDRFVCVVREGHPTVKRKLTLDDYLALSHLLISPRGGSGSIVDSALAEQGLRRRIAVQVPHFLVAPHLVARSNLCLTLAERLAKIFAERERLRVLPPPLVIPGFTMFQIWHERHHHDAGHAWLRGVLAELCRDL